MSSDKIISEPYNELENQFILRLPEGPAQKLRETLRSGVSLKDRLTIKLENDMRKGEVQFDHYFMHARVVDLPCIIESQKTIDNKTFYKTGDICQMMICKEDEDPLKSDEEETKAKKDPAKVNKKYLWPHGITPPMKNVRRRRFRKTLKKKYSEVNEIERELKRLLRSDAECESVKWEICYEDEEQQQQQSKDSKKEVKTENIKEEDMDIVDVHNVAEHDIFGEVSDSDDECGNTVDDEASKFSLGSSRLSDLGQSSQELRGMFLDNDYDTSSVNVKAEMRAGDDDDDDEEEEEEMGSIRRRDPLSYGMKLGDSYDFTSYDQDETSQEMEAYTKEQVIIKLETLQIEIDELKSLRLHKEMELEEAEDEETRQLCQETVEAILNDLLDKEQQFQEFSALLDGQDYGDTEQ